MANLWNFIQFQLGWFALVLSAAGGYPTLGILVMLVLAAIHLGWFATDSEALTLLVVTSLGWLWESLFHVSGLIAFSGYSEKAFTAPVWMAMLWLNFATALNHSLRWLHNRYLLCGICGAIGGPLAFWAGSKFGAAVLTEEFLSLFALSIAWGLLLPLVVLIASHIGRAGSKYVVFEEGVDVSRC